MAKSKSLKLNAVLNTINTLSNVIFPLVSFPYATRVLGAENIGKVTFATSIVSYFVYLAALGAAPYAIREGSKIRDDEKSISKFTSEIFTTNTITTMLSWACLIIIALCVPSLKPYSFILLVESLIVILDTLSLDWLNTVYEDYLFASLRSIVVHVVYIVVLFIFIHNKNDLYIYAILQLITYFGKFAFNLIHFKSKCKIRLTKECNFFAHIKKMIVFFAYTIAVLIYVNADTTMLGFMTNDYHVGLYAVSSKIYGIIKNILAGLYVVTIPKLSQYVSVKETYNSFCKTLSKIIDALTLLLLPMVFGLLMLSKEIVLIISGSDFEAAYTSLEILSVALLFAIYGGIITQCIMIPLKMEKTVLKATIISALLNIILNFVAIRYFVENGAALTTLLAEAFVTIYCYFYVKKYNLLIDKKETLKNFIQCLVASLSFILVIVVIRMFVKNVFGIVLLSIICCACIYTIILVAMKNKLLLGVIKEKKFKLLK